MPSGAKKRKAAKRKKKMGQMTLGPADPPPQDARHRDDLMPSKDNKERDGGSPTSSSSSSPSSRGNCNPRSADVLFGSEAVLISSVAENVGSSKGAALDEKDVEESDVAVKEVAVMSTAESVAKPEDSVVEIAKSEEEVEKPAEESAVPGEEIVALGVEGRQADAAAAEVFEETSDDHRVKVMPLPDEDEVVKQLGESREACCVAGKAEILSVTEVAPPAPLVLHYTKWWNCCGLLDVFAGSGR